MYIKKTFSIKAISFHIRTLELSRLFLGQGKYLIEYLDSDFLFSWDSKQKFDILFREILYPELYPGSFHSIMNKNLPEKPQICFDMHDVLRFTFSWHKKGKEPYKDKRDWDTMLSVCYDNPFHICKNIPLLKIDKKSKDHWTYLFSTKKQYDCFCEIVSLGRDIRKYKFRKLPPFLNVADEQTSMRLLRLCKSTFINCENGG